MSNEYPPDFEVDNIAPSTTGDCAGIACPWCGANNTEPFRKQKGSNPIVPTVIRCSEPRCSRYIHVSTFTATIGRKAARKRRR